MCIFVSRDASGVDRDTEKLPVAISIVSLNDKGVVLEIANKFANERQLSSNIPQILDVLFLEFPTEADIQFKDHLGKQIKIRNQNSDGWWHPNVFSSSLNLEKSKKVKILSQLTVKPHEVQPYPIKCNKVITLAMANRVNETSQPAHAFRIRLPILVTNPAGEERRIVITSEWISADNYLNNDKK